MVYDQETQLGYDEPVPPAHLLGRNLVKAFHRGFDRCILTPAERRLPQRAHSPYSLKGMDTAWREGYDAAMLAIEQGKGQKR